MERKLQEFKEEVFPSITNIISYARGNIYFRPESVLTSSETWKIHERLC